MSEGLINTCKRCGQCCMTFFLAMDNCPLEKDDKEIARWAALHHCEPMGYQTPKGTVLAVNIPLSCKWLKFDDQAGCWSCANYDKRPVVCREYYCKRCSSEIIPDGERKLLDVIMERIPGLEKF